MKAVDIFIIPHQQQNPNGGLGIIVECVTLSHPIQGPRNGSGTELEKSLRASSAVFLSNCEVCTCVGVTSKDIICSWEQTVTDTGGQGCKEAAG